VTATASWRTWWPLVLAVWITQAFFVGAPGWNQNSRFALTRAIVERGSIAIDPEHPLTGDKSFRDGHYYCDKAPGVSWLAVVPYAVLHLGQRALGAETPEVRVQPLDPAEAASGRGPPIEAKQPGDRFVYNRAFKVALWVVTIVAVGGPSALAAFAVARIVARHPAIDEVLARRVAVVYAVGTPALTYATGLYGHQLCGALLVLALAAILEARAPWVAGTLLGAAVVTEYPAAVPAAGLVLFAAQRHGARWALRVALAGVPWALALAAYHHAAFGHPLRTGYDFLVRDEFARGMSVRYGIGSPDLEVLQEILWGRYRGLFWVAPITIAAAWGLVADAVAGERSWRGLARLALAVSVFYVILNASYWMWDGGASLGPRHVVPALGLLALGLPTAWRRAPTLVGALAVISIVHVVVGTAAGPEAPQWGDPIWEHAMGDLWRGTSATSNLGGLLGLPGPLRLLPLVPVWWWAWERTRMPNAADQKRPDTDSPAP
jgi:hypothetical protein